jgi:hypothetical protein
VPEASKHFYRVAAEVLVDAYVAPAPFVNSDVIVNTALCCPLVRFSSANVTRATNKRDASGSSRASRLSYLLLRPSRLHAMFTLTFAFTNTHDPRYNSREPHESALFTLYH